MKKVKANKLNLNKQTITHLGQVKGGMLRPHTKYVTECGLSNVYDTKTKCGCPA